MKFLLPQESSWSAVLGASVVGLRKMGLPIVLSVVAAVAFGSEVHGDTSKETLAELRLLLDKRGGDYEQMEKSYKALISRLQTSKRANESTVVARKLLEQTESEYGNESLETARALAVLAKLTSRYEGFAKGIPLQSRRIGILEARLGASHLDLADALDEAAFFLRMVGRTREATDMLVRSLGIRERALKPDDLRLAASLSAVGRGLESLDMYTEALGFFERAQAIHDRHLAEDSSPMGHSLFELAQIYGKLGMYMPQARVNLRLLRINESMHGSDSQNLVGPLNTLAISYANAGQTDLALPLALRAVSLIEQNPAENELVLANMLANLGVIFLDRGNFSEAKQALHRALTLREKKLPPDDEAVGSSLQKLGSLYAELGLPGLAISYYNRSFAILVRSMGSTSDEAATALLNIASLRLDLREPDVALPLALHAASMFENRYGIHHVKSAAAMATVAGAHEQMGSHGDALLLRERALAIQRKFLGPDHVEVAMGLSSLANIHISLGNLPEALRVIQESIRTLDLDESGRSLRWALEAKLSHVHRLKGELDLSSYWGKQSVNSLQGLRGSLTTLDKELQSSFLKDRSWPYTNLADLLIAQGRIPEAQQVLQMLKERELYDEVLRGEVPAAGRQVDLTGLERAKYSDYYRIREQLVALASERRQLQAKKEGERSPAEQRRLDEITEKLFPQVNSAMNTFMVDLQRDFSKSAAARGEDTDFRLKATQDGLRSTIEDLASPRGEPAARAVGLQYVVTDKRLSIILTVPGGPPIARQIDLDRVELNKRINQITADMKSPPPDLVAMDGDKGIQRQAQELYRILIEPVLPDLKKADARTLMISATDVLRFLPFAVLHNGKNYLVQDYALAVYNEAATKMPKPTKKDWRIAGFGLSDAVPGLKALNAVPAELKAVLSHSANGKSWLNKPFNRGQLRDALNGEFDAVHLASHFVVQLGDTNGSRLYLGDKSALSLEQFAGNDIRFDGIELVTLSACETAVGGGRTSYGQEMESLSAKVQKQGAAAVLATLWQVADASTGKLMARFYDNKLAASMNKAQALRAAQLALLSGQERLSKQQDWMHPFYWAPFVLMGNWR